MIQRGWRVARIGGIAIEVHFTFLFILLWGGWQSWLRYRTRESILYGIVAILGLFLCVLIHELGHGLQARMLGLRVRRVLLLPIGGMVELETNPAYPWIEMVVALAGPLVNGIAALSLWVILQLVEPVSLTWAAQVNALGRPGILALTRYLMIANGVLFLFNLFPAFPMDGGRILRAALATLFPYDIATGISAGAGVLTGISIGVLPFIRSVPNRTVDLILWLTGVILLIGSIQEARYVRRRRALVLTEVGAVHDLHHETLSLDHPVDERLIRRFFLHDVTLPVIKGDQVVGVLPYTDVRHLRELPEGQTVADFMRRDFPTLATQQTLWAAFRDMQASDLSALPVIQQGHFAGMLTLAHIERAERYYSRRSSAPSEFLPGETPR